MKNKSEQLIIKNADKIASMVEDLDALSWARITEIGQRLAESISEEERHILGRELKSIAQANSSLYEKLGIHAPDRTGILMASGIEIMEGFAQENSKPQVYETVSSLEEADLTSDFFSSEEQSEDEFIQRGKSNLVPIDTQQSPFLVSLTDSFIDSEPDFDLEPPPLPLNNHKDSEKKKSLEQSNQIFEGLLFQEDKDYSETERSENPVQSKKQKHDFSTFKQLYEGRSSGLCLYEDAHGHIVAVDSSKLL